MTEAIDVAVVGGGAAGIAAARRLVGYGRSVLILEALPRLGGRAHTLAVDGLALDLGCGWLHSARRNPLAREAEARGWAVVRGAGAWRRRPPLRFAAARRQQDGWKAYERLAEALRASPPASDRAGDAMAPDDPWRPFADAVSSYVNGVELDQLSVSDFLAYEDCAGDANWRLPAGYGALVAELGAGLPAALSTPVTTVTQGDHVALETAAGAVVARAAIVTASSAVLASGAIRFTPAIDDHLHAAHRLPLGLADKVFLSLPDGHGVPAEINLIGRLDSAATGSYYLRPLARPVIECFLGGAHARVLEAEGEAAAVAFAREELARLLGAGTARALTPIAVTAWGREASVRGSYSHALPGCADARAALARPVSERLCLAGEACSLTDFSTAHGAWTSGQAAADWIEQGLAGGAR